jgi:hypothetical protein
MNEQEIFSQFPEVEWILENNFPNLSFQNIDITIEKLDENALNQVPWVYFYHGRSFWRESGKKFWLIHREGQNSVITEFERGEGLAVCEKIIIQGLPHYIVEAEYFFGDNTVKEEYEVEMTIYELGDIHDLGNLLNKNSRSRAPTERAIKAFENFSLKEESPLIGFVYFPPSESFGERLVVGYHSGSKFIRIKDHI